MLNVLLLATACNVVRLIPKLVLFAVQVTSSTLRNVLLALKYVPPVLVIQSVLIVKLVILSHLLFLKAPV